MFFCKYVDKLVDSKPVITITYYTMKIKTLEYRIPQNQKFLEFPEFGRSDWGDIRFGLFGSRTIQIINCRSDLFGF